jgi:hypothetical protein
MLELPDRAEPPLRRAWIIVGALLMSGLALYLALFLGAWGFDFRRTSQHDGRLRRLVQQHPTLARVVQGLADEGSPLIESPEGPAALVAAAIRYGGPKAGEVRTKGSRWPTTRVFRAGDMIYFLYFDGDDVLQEYTWVTRR